MVEQQLWYVPMIYITSRYDRAAGQRALFAAGVAALVQRLLATGSYTTTETLVRGVTRPLKPLHGTNICPINLRSWLGHSINGTDPKGRTTFHITPTGGHAPIIELLLVL